MGTKMGRLLAFTFSIGKFGYFLPKIGKMFKGGNKYVDERNLFKKNNTVQMDDSRMCMNEWEFCKFTISRNHNASVVCFLWRNEKYGGLPQPFDSALFAPF